MKAKTVIDVALGEAGGKTAAHRYNDLKHIFSVMVNRARATGTSLADVALKTSQFNAYGKKMPAGVNQYRPLAERALKEVLEQGPVTDAMYYATPAATKNLPRGLEFQTNTTAHQYFTDPQMRGIVTRQGAKPLTGARSIVDGLLAEGRIPTPTFADRPGTGINQSDSATGIMAAINPATPMSVTRGVLSEPGIGVSAVAERGLSPSGEASGLLSYRAPEDMASMQAKANLGRQRLEAANGSLNLTSAQTADAMKRRDAALGILHASNPVDAINAVSPLSSPAVTPSALANAYSQMAGSMGQAGVLGLSGQKVLDLDNDPLGVRGKLAPAPGALAVESMPTVDTTVAGPATSVAINTPQTMGRVSQPVGLLSNDEYGMVRDQQQRLSEMGTNRAIQTKQALKKGLSAFGGGVLGGLIAGPIGSVVGGLLGPAIVNGGILTGRGTNYFPATPSGPVKGDGKQTDYGRSVQKSSGQYDRAVKSGSAGLY